MSVPSDPETVHQVNESLKLIQSQPNSPGSSLIDIATIKRFIKQLKPRKAPGIDGIDNRCIKALPNKGLKFITTIINACLRLSYFPRIWKESKVIPIKKPNKPSDNPGSYRPISLLTSLSKILEKAIQLKLIEFTEDNNILPAEQYGFRRQHNTIHPILRINIWYIISSTMGNPLEWCY